MMGASHSKKPDSQEGALPGSTGAASPASEKTPAAVATENGSESKPNAVVVGDNNQYPSKKESEVNESGVEKNAEKKMGSDDYQTEDKDEEVDEKEAEAVVDEEQQIDLDDSIIKTTDAGNISFELMFSPAAANGTSHPRFRNEHQRPVTAMPSLDDINLKLNLAGKRKQEFEQKRLEKIRADSEVRRGEIVARKAEIVENFRKAAEEDLSQKMEQNKENRDKQITQIKQTADKELKKVSEALEALVLAASEEKESIDKKMDDASRRREEHLKAIQVKNLNHVSQMSTVGHPKSKKVQEVRQSVLTAKNTDLSTEADQQNHQSG